MAKRKITVTVDEELVETAHALGAESLSSVVNRALEREVDRRARHATLGRLLAEWDEAHGPVDEDTAAWASAQFDRVDGAADDPEPMVTAPPAQTGAA